MTANRRVGTDWRERRILATRFVVQQRSHAVQALELEGNAWRAHLQYGRDAVGVVRRELRVQERRVREQSCGATEIGHIGVDLARVNRISAQSAFLAAFDLRV